MLIKVNNKISTKESKIKLWIQCGTFTKCEIDKEKEINVEK